jgi:exodeoxyribonuclease VII large subunit
LARVTHNLSRQYSSLTRHTSEYRRRTDQSLGRLESALRYPRERVAALQAKLDRGLDRLTAASRAHAQYALTLQQRLSDRTANLVLERRQRVTGLTRLLRGFDPQAVLARGYSITRSEGRIVRRASDTAAGDGLMIQLAEGIIAVEVRENR